MEVYNLAIVRQSFAQVVFTHKVQEAAAEKNAKKSFIVKIINIILVSLILVLFWLQSQNQSNLFFTFIGMALTIAEIVFLVIQLSFSFEDKMRSHKGAALKYLGLRDRYKNLITDIMSNTISETEIKTQRDSLQNEYQAISDLSPQTDEDAYDKAQSKLSTKGSIKGEEFTWSDDEIDRFLPEKLRLK